MKKVIITGSTGMIGKGVLYECLDHPRIEKVLVINRNTIGIEHPKLKEILLKDFSHLGKVQDQLIGYDACFYCMGVSVIGMNEERYTHITYTIGKLFADMLYKLNPSMVFNYVSGTGTDSTEKGRSMWARVKGKTENYVLNKGFKDAYAFRPGAIIPEKSIKSRTRWYNMLYFITRPLFPLLKKSKGITTTTKIGLAMINSLIHPSNLKHLENKEINQLAEH